MNKVQKVLLTLIAAYVNAIAFGYRYGVGGNHDFQIPLLNWLRDPSLYPGDPIRDAFHNYPTAFWPVVAWMSRFADPSTILAGFFIATKIIFFLGLIELLLFLLEDIPGGGFWTGIAVFAVSLSRVMNGSTPFGESDILNAYQTQTSLAVALLVWYALFLMQRRWIAAGAILGVVFCCNALFAVFSFAAWGLLALLDLKKQYKSILAGTAVASAIMLPWAIFSRGTPAPFPPSYVSTIMMHYSAQFSLRGKGLYTLLLGVGYLGVGLAAIYQAHRFGLKRALRLEILTASFLFPFAIGVLVTFVQVPMLIRMQFLRADSFLVLYSLILAQLYGVALLVHGINHRKYSLMLFGATALLVSLGSGFSLLALFYAAFLLSLFEDSVEPLLTRIAMRSPSLVQVALALIPFGGLLAMKMIHHPIHAGWIAAMILPFAVLLGGSFREFIWPAACALILALSLLVTAPSWNPATPLSAELRDWRDVQVWCRDHSTKDTRFLVPPFPGGFRAYSLRSSFVDWADGMIVQIYPPYAPVFRAKVADEGIPLTPYHHDREDWRAAYRQESWERVNELAHSNGLSYVVQYREVKYPASPVYANDAFAVYAAR